MERQEAYAEHRCHHNYHPHCLVPFLPSRHGDTLVGHRAAEDLGHPPVAHHQTHKRQDEAEAGESHAVWIVGHRKPWRTQIVAHCAVALDSCCSKVNRWRAQDGDHQPNPSADIPGHLATTLLVPHCERMANAHVALHTDAGEEEDAAMQITETETRKNC